MRWYQRCRGLGGGGWRSEGLRSPDCIVGDVNLSHEVPGMGLFQGLQRRGRDVGDLGVGIADLGFAEETFLHSVSRVGILLDVGFAGFALVNDDEISHNSALFHMDTVTVYLASASGFSMNQYWFPRCWPKFLRNGPLSGKS